MHIRDFFDRIETRPPSDHKLALVGPHREAAKKVGILDTYLANDAMDHFFAKMLAAPLARARQQNYVLASLLGFGVHQLTMRRHDGGQCFVQAGCLDGHEFVCGMLRNVAVQGVLVGAGAQPLPMELWAEPEWERWSRVPERVDMDAATYFREAKPCVGFLSIVNPDGPERVLETLDLGWDRLHTYADIVVQGKPTLVTDAMRQLGETRPEVPIRIRSFLHVLPGGAIEEQNIAVFPKVPHHYASMSPGIPDYALRRDP